MSAFDSELQIMAMLLGEANKNSTKLSFYPLHSVEVWPLKVENDVRENLQVVHGEVLEDLKLKLTQLYSDLFFCVFN